MHNGHTPDATEPYMCLKAKEPAICHGSAHAPLPVQILPPQPGIAFEHGGRSRDAGVLSPVPRYRCCWRHQLIIEGPAASIVVQVQAQTRSYDLHGRSHCRCEPWAAATLSTLKRARANAQHSPRTAPVRQCAGTCAASYFVMRIDTMQLACQWVLDMSNMSAGQDAHLTITQCKFASDANAMTALYVRICIAPMHG